jgi:hypothetical protein
MEACYGGADVMERSCAVARGIDINTILRYPVVRRGSPSGKNGAFSRGLA